MTGERTLRESQTQSTDYAKQPWIVSVWRMLGNWRVMWSTIPFTLTTTLSRIKTHAFYGKLCGVASHTVHQMRNTEWYDILSFETPSRCRCFDKIGFILPPEENIKHLTKFITFKNAVQVELDHRIKCTWATCATVILYTSGTNDGRRNQKPLTTTANVEDCHPDEEKIQRM